MEEIANISFCKKCILNNGDIDTIIDKNGLCNTCNHTDMQKSISLFRDASKNTKRYDKYLQTYTKDVFYDSLLMISGGKDSIYMLYKLLTEKKARPLAYTFNHPFESKKAIKNIEKTISKLHAEHYNYTPNIAIYKKILKYAFTKNCNKPLAYGIRAKFPCLVCSNYMRVCALVFAFKMGIPYVLFCADPFQMLSFESKTEKLLIDFKNSCREEIFNELPEKKVIDEMMSMDSDKLPEMIFPYATMNDYNAENIVNELKKLDLYNSCQRETHCSLHALLNYYSIKRFNTYFYEREMAVDVRNGKISRLEVLRVLKDFKEAVLDVVAKKELSMEDKLRIRELLLKIYGSPDAVEHELNEFIHLRETANFLELDLNDI